MITEEDLILELNKYHQLWKTVGKKKGDIHVNQ